METDEDVERQIMEVDYFAQTRLTRLILPDMIAQGGGKIVMVSSVAGLLTRRYGGRRIARGKQFTGRVA